MNKAEPYLTDREELQRAVETKRLLKAESEEGKGVF